MTKPGIYRFRGDSMRHFTEWKHTSCYQDEAYFLDTLSGKHAWYKRTQERLGYSQLVGIPAERVPSLYRTKALLLG